MATVVATPPEKFKVDCPNCQGKYDALKASFCNCLGKERSLRCPHCDACFCTAPSAYRTKFWADAPEALWQRRREATPATPKTNPGPAEISRPMVLLVDDDRVVQAIAVRVITALGYGVAMAGDGAEGLEMAMEYRPELILSDAMMPKLDGREMGRRVKESPGTKDTKVVIMTSLYTDARYKYEALRDFKADAYLSKPLDARKLREILSEYLGPPKRS